MSELHQRVAVLSMPRTGSTMLTARLSSHPGIKIVGDLFNEQGWHGKTPIHIALRDKFSKKFDDLDHRVKHQRRILDALFGMAIPGCVIGFKHHLTGDKSVTETLVSDPRTTKILLRRPNVLASYSSWLLVKAKKFNNNDSAADSEGGEEVGSGGSRTISFDKDDFERFLRQRRKVDDYWVPRIKESAGDHTFIEYDEARTDAGIERVLKFIGVDHQVPLKIRTEKRNSDDIVSRFSNPTEVSEYLKEQNCEEWATESA